MNIREGMRRLGFFLGASGGILGGLLAYSDAATVWNNLRAHQKFEAALGLPAVRKTVKGIASGKADWFVQHAPATAPSEQQTVNGIAQLPPGWKIVDDYAAPSAQARATASSAQFTVVSSEDQATGGITIFEANSLLKGNRDGIKSVSFDSGKRVTWIGFTTGDWAYSTEAPKFSAYLLLLAFPVVGFFVPWAAVRVLTWVGTGFFAAT